MAENPITLKSHFVGEMESDQEDRNTHSKSITSEKVDTKDDNLNISHEDLSDVSDLESMGPEEPDNKDDKKVYRSKRKKNIAQAD